MRLLGAVLGIRHASQRRHCLHRAQLSSAYKLHIRLWAGHPDARRRGDLPHTYKVEELDVILKRAKEHAFIHPLIVTGMCMAMRRGDCCTLLRESVDLEAGFITVKTSKTGETVQIPIFPLLRKVLEEALAKPSPRAPHYVFQHLEARYVVNPDHLTDRVKRVLRASGFINEQTGGGQPP